MKYKIQFYVSFLILIICMIIIYNNHYYIENTESSILSNLEKYYDNKTSNDISMEIMNIIPIEDTRTSIVLLKMKDIAGYAQLEKGWNNKYKIIDMNMGYKDNEIIYKDIQIKKDLYGVVFVFKENKNIGNIRVQSLKEQGKYLFIAEARDSDYYINYSPYPKQEEGYWGELLFHDKDGNLLDSF